MASMPKNVEVKIVPVFDGEVLSPTVNVSGLASTGLVVGPDDLLVLHCPFQLNRAEIEEHRRNLDAALPRSRYLIVCGDWQLWKVADVDTRRLEIEA